jgi:hypothetical protein
MARHFEGRLVVDLAAVERTSAVCSLGACGKLTRARQRTALALLGIRPLAFLLGSTRVFRTPKDDQARLNFGQAIFQALGASC